MLRAICCYGLLIACIWLKPAKPLGQEVANVGDQDLVNFLTGIEILGERRFPPLAVRIIKFRPDGECDPEPPDCPRATLYVSVSEFGEFPDKKVYVVTGSYGWSFQRWLPPTSESDAKSARVQFELRELVATSEAAGWWDEKVRAFDVSFEGLRIQ